MTTAAVPESVAIPPPLPSPQADEVVLAAVETATSSVFRLVHTAVQDWGL